MYRIKTKSTKSLQNQQQAPPTTISMSAEDEVLLPNSLVVYDWATQLSILKNFYKKSDLTVKYVDDEDEEVTIGSQKDLECAYEVAKRTQNRLRFVLRDDKGDVVGKPQLNIDPKLLQVRKADEVLLNTAAGEQQLATTKQQARKQHHQQQQQLIIIDSQWLTSYLDKFKADLLGQMEMRMKSLLREQQQQPTNKVVESPFSSFDDDDDSTNKQLSVQAKTERLLGLLSEARVQNRSFKAAYLEEELATLDVFRAEFIGDSNMPDGTKCGPETRFTKSWLVKNTGAFAWRADHFPVSLVCLSGFGHNKAGQNVEVSGAPGETVCLSADLVAPSAPGVYVSEWALQCQTFQFGPKIWCTIEVVLDAKLVQLVESHHASLLDSDVAKSLLMPVPLKPSPVKELVEAMLEDEEFVVIPDCLNLEKKWKPKERSPAPSESGESSVSFLNLTQELLDDDDVLVHSTGGGRTSSASTTIVCVTSTPTPSLSSQSSVVEKQQQPEVVAEEKKQQPPVTVVETVTEVAKQPEKKSKRASRRNSHKENKEESKSATTNQKQQQQEQESSFNLIKDAFTNLRGPCFDHIYRVDFGLDSAIYPYVKPENPMTKLISMGFANRVLNEQLLKKYSFDIERVIQDLCERTENVRY